MSCPRVFAGLNPSMIPPPFLPGAPALRQISATGAPAPALYSVALMDDICPPSNVVASFNHYAGPKEIEVYPYNGHEGGGAHQVARALEFAQSIVG